MRKLGIDGMDWLEMTQKARTTRVATHTIMEELALEIYDEISAVEDDFRDMIRTLPFKDSSEFFKFFVHYQKWTGHKVDMAYSNILNY